MRTLLRVGALLLAGASAQAQTSVQPDPLKQAIIDAERALMNAQANADSVSNITVWTKCGHYESASITFRGAPVPVAIPLAEINRNPVQFAQWLASWARMNKVVVVNEDELFPGADKCAP